jgi:hypothetical protein
MKLYTAAYLAKPWNSASNRALLENDKTNLAACTLHSLDKLGMNHLEIISISQLVGQRVSTMPTADCDFLNAMQDKYSIIFNYDAKTKAWALMEKGLLKQSASVLTKVNLTDFVKMVNGQLIAITGLFTEEQLNLAM